MSDKRPLVSVIIPTCNSAATLGGCLDSLQAQTYPNIEIIVVDNYSHDSSREIASTCASVYTHGPERSAQVNFGARQAHGEYLYRIDADFILNPEVVEACVKRAQGEHLAMIAVPNRSLGRSYWSRVRALERDTYLDDELIVAARFIRMDAFFEVGGFDESLNACEDYDLHHRLIARGFRMGRVEPGETHLGEPERLWDYARKSFYYGPSAWRYLRKDPRRGMKQLSPVRGSYLRHWRMILGQPSLGVGLLALKIVQYASAGAGVILNGLGLSDDRGRLVTAVWLSLGLLAAALWGLLSGLDRFGAVWGSWLKGLVVLTALILWQFTGRWLSRRRDAPLPKALFKAALAFVPLIPGGLLGGALSPEVWMFLFSLGLATWIAWLVFLVAKSDPGRGGIPIAAMLVGACAFTLVLTNNAWNSLIRLNYSAFDLALFDQALWKLAQGEAMGLSSMMYSSIIQGSVLVNTPAPVLLLYAPFYALGLGGPMLLLASQIVALGLSSLLIFTLARDFIGSWPAFILTTGFVAYFATIRAGMESFQIQSLAAPALLLSIFASRKGRYQYFYPAVIFVWMCGIIPSLAAAGLGLYLLLIRQEKLHGLFTSFMSLVWVGVLAFVLVPLFGGDPGAPLAAYLPREGQPPVDFLVSALFRPVVWRYLILLLAPLAFTPLLGASLLLPACLPVLTHLISSQPAELAFPGSSAWLIAPFVFLAAAQGLDRLSARFQDRERVPAHYAGAVLVLVGCILTSSFMVPDKVRALFHFQVPSYYRSVNAILSKISPDQSLATQSALAVRLAHRSELQILPRVEDVDVILFDLFHPNREPNPDSYEESLFRAYRNPEYGLKVAQGGYLLFQRGLDPAEDLHRLALASPLEADYRFIIPLGEKVTYRGFSLQTRQVRAYEPFLLTHFWECISPIDRPYLLFTAYPGGRRFEEAAYGLYPVGSWQPGDVIRHEQLIQLPDLPPGEEYEIVVGLWFDQGEPAVKNPQQFLGQDVIRIATLKAHENGRYEITPYQNLQGD